MDMHRLYINVPFSSKELMTKFYLTLKAFPNLWMQQHGSVMGRFGVRNGSVDRIYT